MTRPATSPAKAGSGVIGGATDSCATFILRFLRYQVAPISAAYSGIRTKFVGTALEPPTVNANIILRQVTVPVEQTLHSRCND